jgi:hypothetical protein
VKQEVELTAENNGRERSWKLEERKKDTNHHLGEGESDGAGRGTESFWKAQRPL